jgi:hypothetical protein
LVFVLGFHTACKKSGRNQVNLTSSIPSQLRK